MEFLMKKKRIAVIGLGGIAQKGHLPVLTSMPELELFFYSRTTEKVKTLAEQYRIQKWTTNLDELLGWKPDCGYILTPTPTHAELATICIKAGMDVFMEKPATESSSETRKLAELADANKRIAMVAFNRRYAPLSVKGKELWGNRQVTMANFQKSRSKPGFKGIPMHVSEELVHVIDLIRFFGGEAKAVATKARMDNEGMVIEVVCLLEIQKGGLVTLTASLQAGHWYEHYELNGEGATLNLNVFSDLHLTEKERTQSWKEPYDSTWNSNLFGRGFVGQIDHFLKCVETRQQPQTNLWEALKTQLLVEDIITKYQE
jgi:virulence factor